MNKKFMVFLCRSKWEIFGVIENSCLLWPEFKWQKSNLNWNWTGRRRKTCVWW